MRNPTKRKPTGPMCSENGILGLSNKEISAMGKKRKPVKTVPVNKDGWQRWQQPIMNGYIMKCCDCGLSHEFEFRILKVASRKGHAGWWKAEEMDSENYRVSMRARRGGDPHGRK